MSAVVRPAVRNEHGVTARDRVACGSETESSAQMDSMSNYAFFLWRAYTTGASLICKGFLSKDSHMKKRDNRQKLSLSRETLRRLEAPLLSGVVGGTVLTCIPAKCTSDLSPSAEETACCG